MCVYKTLWIPPLYVVYKKMYEVMSVAHHLLRCSREAATDASWFTAVCFFFHSKRLNHPPTAKHISVTTCLHGGRSACGCLHSQRQTSAAWNAGLHLCPTSIHPSSPSLLSWRQSVSSYLHQSCDPGSRCLPVVCRVCAILFHHPSCVGNIAWFCQRGCGSRDVCCRCLLERIRQ